MADGTKFLDLDNMDDELDIVVKLKGKSHKLTPITVRDFIQNTKIVNDLGPNPSVEKEVDALVKMISRAFPTMSPDDLYEMSLSNLNKLMEFAQSHNGHKAVEKEAAKEATNDQEANPPAAPAS